MTQTPNTSQITDEMLMAYCDGELNELDSRRVEKAIASDPELEAEFARQVALKAEILLAIEDAVTAPMSSGLAETLEATRGVSFMPAANKPASAERSFWQIPTQIAAAVAVVVGGLWLTAPSHDDCCAGAELASTEAGISPILAGYLNTIEDNSQVAGVLVQESYLATAAGASADDRSNPQFCRTFRFTAGAAGDPTKQGLACRQSSGDWRLEALVPEIPQGAYMPAGPEQDHPIDVLVRVMHKIEMGGEHAHLRE